ncbi:MAG: hypothetical protein HC831_27975 [Chloroflexia bacterium]|nr:hypothetical protein [Chloroflexia bacterium]
MHYAAVLVGLLLLFPKGIYAQCTVSNPYGQGETPVAGNYLLGQSFTACQDGLLNRIRLLNRLSNTNRTITIYSGQGTGGANLGSVSGINFIANVDPLPPVPTYTEIDVSSLGISVVSGNTYTFNFDGDALINGVRLYAVIGGNVYAGGQGYYNGGAMPNDDIIFEVDIISVPSVTSSAATSVDILSAALGGNVTASGGGTVTERGVVYSSSDNTPTIGELGVTQDANGTTGTGTFSESITGLTANTTYYFQAYAINGAGTSYGGVQSFTTLTDVDGDVTLSATVTEPVTIPEFRNTVGEAIDVFDFTISDGGTSDALPLNISQIVINVSGTSTDTERANVTWRLNGPDASNITAVYNATSDIITFSGLSISVADGASEVYTVNAYYNTTSGLTDGHTFILSVDGDTDFSVASSGTKMGTTTAINNGTGSLIDLAPVLSSFTRQTPSGSPTNADILIFRATFSEDVTNVDASDFTVTGTTASITNVSSVSANVYDLTVSGGNLVNLNATVGLNVAGGHNIMDLANNPLPVSEPTTDQTYVVDNISPVLSSFTRFNPGTATTGADVLIFRATFDSDVQNVDAADFTVNSTTTATITNVSAVSTSVYEITVSGGDLAGYNGTVGLNVAGGQNILDLAGNALATAEPITDEIYTVSNTSLPTVITTVASAITTNSASSGGNVTSDGGASVTARGVCWSTDPNPTLADNFTTGGSGTGLFTSTLAGLNSNTTYYYRAYATNSNGIAYGAEYSFLTPCNAPVAPTGISGTTSSCSGENVELTRVGGALMMHPNGDGMPEAVVELMLVLEQQLRLIHLLQQLIM